MRWIVANTSDRHVGNRLLLLDCILRASRWTVYFRYALCIYIDGTKICKFAEKFINIRFRNIVSNHNALIHIIFTG